jgi:hypothetical protein
MATWGAGRRDGIGGVLGLTGLTLLARVITNTELKRLVGVGAGRRAIDIQKTMVDGD